MSDPIDLLAAGIDPAASTAPSAGWAPPTPEALAGIFPQLEVISLLGRGGMGAVYKARQTHLDRIVALKILAPERGADPAFAERFAREARALARLQHPHIVTLHDFGRAGDWLYLVMEHVDGANLRQVMTTGRLSPVESLRLVGPLCEALEHAHAQGVVHRDLKPENILIDGQGRPKIADFGLAKLRSNAEGDLTQTGDTLGTLHYMAPEQVAGAADVDHRADVYALGVVFYEMLTGNLPLGRCQPPSHTGSDPRLDEVVLKSLEREPGKRWQSAEELRRAVAGAQGGQASPPEPQPRVAERVDVGPVHVGPDGVRVGDGIRIDRDGVQFGSVQLSRDGIRTSTRPQADGDGDRKLFRSGMWMLVGGIVVAVWLALADVSASSLSLWRLAFVTDLLMTVGGISLLLRTGLVIGLAGAIAALLILPWCWSWHWSLGLMLTIIELVVVGRVLNLPRLNGHYGSLRPWQRKILPWILLAWLLPAAIITGIAVCHGSVRLTSAPFHINVESSPQKPGLQPN